MSSAPKDLIHFTERGSGKPLLLVHGLMVTGEMFDPVLERFFLFGLEHAMRIGRRHHFRFIIGRDAAPEFALLRVPGDDWFRAVVIGVGGIRLIEPQLGLPGFLIEAVALEAVFRKYRADVAVEVEFFIGGVRERRACHERQENK